MNERQETSTTYEQDAERFAAPVDITKKDRFAGIKNYLKARPPKKRLLIITGVSVALLAGGGFAATRISDSTTLNPVPEITSNYVPPITTVASPLTGIQIDPALAARPVTAVMIENSDAARPQAGLQEAGIVFEAIAEGGITRFMALYQESQPTNIGPIRSARPYYVEWARGFDANFVHSGGSPEALALIPALGVNDLDHGRYDTRLADRVSSRFSPHNVFSSMSKIDALSKEVGLTASEFTGFARKDDAPATPEAPATAAKITMNISGFNYNTSYTYIPESNSYARTMAGQPHTDNDSGKQIMPKVLIALEMTYGIHSNGIHSVYGSIGSGNAIIFQDGKKQTATWRKASQSAPLELINASGEPLQLNAGQTWITAIQPGRVVSE